MTIIVDDDHGQRLDRYLKKSFPTLSFGQTQKLIRTGQIRVNGKRAKADSKLSAGDVLRLPPSLQNQDQNPKPHFSQKDRDFIESIILYEDEDILALNKPAGLAVQGGTKTTRHIDAMMNSYTKKGIKPRLVHRLDRDTSGVFILAKNTDTARELTHQFQSQDIQKTYWALTTPAPTEDDGVINAKIGKAPTRRDGGEVMIHDPEHGQKAVTEFEVLDRAGKDIAFVAFYPKTGRTHQIRVHAQIAGFPLLGDKKYNDQSHDFVNAESYDGLHLHARAIDFQHPQMGETVTITAPLSKEFFKSWQSFGFTV